MSRFQLGQVVATALLQKMNELGEIPMNCLKRQIAGDWGDMPGADKRANDAALANGSRIFSSYRLKDEETKCWIITEAVGDDGTRASTLCTVALRLLMLFVRRRRRRSFHCSPTDNGLFSPHGL